MTPKLHTLECAAASHRAEDKVENEGRLDAQQFSSERVTMCPEQHQEPLNVPHEPETSLTPVHEGKCMPTVSFDATDREAEDAIR